jgi:cysteine desulfurase
MSRIYLDHAATTPVTPEVLDAMKPYFSVEYGNASSIHDFGVRAREAVEKSREVVTGFLGADKDSIIFTGSGTESDNIAVQGSAFRHGRSGPHIITSMIEHPAVFATCEFLQTLGFEVTFLPVNGQGLVDPESLKKEIKKNTVLISIMYANNEIGTIQPVSEIGGIAREHGINFHTDAVQAFGKVPVNVRNENITLLSGSGHKLYGPKGVGILYISDRSAVSAIMRGGHHEMNLRPSTENVPCIVGLAKAVETAAGVLEGETRRELELRDYLIDGVLSGVPGSWINGSKKRRLANNANFGFKGLSGFDLVLGLDREGIACSTGSACHTASVEPSRVLTSLGLSNEDAMSCIRVTIGRGTVKDDIDYFLQKLPPLIKELKTL